jgi:hypothetical protein
VFSHVSFCVYQRVICELELTRFSAFSVYSKGHSVDWFRYCAQQPGSHARRWGMLHRFDAGRLANTKSINEDLTEIPTDQLHSCCIDPDSITWQPRQQG